MGTAASVFWLAQFSKGEEVWAKIFFLLKGPQAQYSLSNTEVPDSSGTSKVVHDRHPVIDCLQHLVLEGVLSVNTGICKSAYFQCMSLFHISTHNFIPF